LGSVARQNQVAHNRIDLAIPAPAAEDAVMAHAGLHMVPLHVRLETRAKIMGDRALTQRANIVALALHGQQSRLAYGLEIDRLAFVGELPFGQWLSARPRVPRWRAPVPAPLLHGPYPAQIDATQCGAVWLPPFFNNVFVIVSFWVNSAG